jgi:hypothetical protein
MIHKAKVVLNLAVLSIPDKIQQARTFAAGVKKNQKLARQDDALPDKIEAAAQALDDAYAEALYARSISVTKTAVMKQLEDALDSLLTALGHYVEAESRGDEAVIKSTGMSVKKRRTPAGIPGMPEALAATEGSMNGSIALKWKAVKGSRSYLVRATTTVADAKSWQQVGVSTRANVLVEELTSGLQYWFQVSAIGTAGQGPWSDPSTKIAP